MVDIKIHPISEVPQNIWALLYEMRLKDAAAEPYEDYIKAYQALYIDGKLYLSDDDQSARMSRLKQINMDSDSSFYDIIRMVDVYFQHGYLIKNRYGYNSI